MTLQTKVTFGSVLLATVVVTAISGVNLGSFMDLELESTLERADVIKGVATDEVTEGQPAESAPLSQRCVVD